MVMAVDSWTFEYTLIIIAIDVEIGVEFLSATVWDEASFMITSPTVVFLAISQDFARHPFFCYGGKRILFFIIREEIIIKIIGLMVKCTPERGHNALFFIPLQVFIML